MERELNVPSENYALFHGNLSVVENEKSLRWIIDVWLNNNIAMPLVIAGKKPKSDLKKLLAKQSFVRLIENPTNEKMTELISAAEVNLLITFQSTGVKLKLLNALVQGKRCIANPLMVEGTDLGQFCEVIDDESELANALLEKNNLDEEQLLERMKYLKSHFDAIINTKEALEFIESKSFSAEG